MGVSDLISQQINKHIDETILNKHEKFERGNRRPYLGASIIGRPCARQVQYMWKNVNVDRGKGFPPKILRTFKIGDVFEEMLINYLWDAGFNLQTKNSKGQQFGFKYYSDQIRGHVDGIIKDGPKDCGPYPRLWECKSMNDKKFFEFENQGVKRSHPVYYYQMQIYMDQLKLTTNPGILTAMNKDNSRIVHEAVPYNEIDAKKILNRAIEIINKTERKLPMPRVSKYRDNFECRYCSWQDRCWSHE
jgi:hypothetical protein